MTSNPVLGAPASAITFGRAAPGVFVRDIPKALAFYSNVLGFTKTFENGDPVGFMILRKDAAELHLSRVKDHKPSTGNVVHLMVDDIDALHAACVAASVKIIKSMADKDYGLRAFVFADPDGNRIDVGQPMNPAPGGQKGPFETRDLSGAHFKTCRLAGAIFDDVDLRQAQFTNVNLSGVTINDANIKGLTIYGIDIHALVQAELARRR